MTDGWNSKLTKANWCNRERLQSFAFYDSHCIYDTHEQ